MLLPKSKRNHLKSTPFKKTDINCNKLSKKAYQNFLGGYEKQGLNK